MIRFLVLLMFLPFAWVPSNNAAEPTPAPEKSVLKVEATNTDALAAKVERLSLRDRRRMGLTLGNLIRAGRDLQDIGEPVTAEAIAERVAEQNAQAMAEVMKTKAINWENIIAFIQRLLPLILQIISIFTSQLYEMPQHIDVEGQQAILAMMAPCTDCCPIAGAVVRGTARVVAAPVRAVRARRSRVAGVGFLQRGPVRRVLSAPFRVRCFR
jgi:hypothetical protein